MIRRSVLDRGAPLARVNVTPMIDVVMCLIVFYLMVGQLALSRGAGVRLPDTERGVNSPATRGGDPVVVGVRPDGTLLLDGVEIAAQRLGAALGGRMGERPDARVEVRADRGAPYGLVRPALDAARDAGIAEVDLITERGP